MKKYILILFLSGLFQAVFGQANKFDSLVTKGINEIYNLQFEDAEKTFSIVRNNYPKHPSGIFFDAMIDWWRIMIDFNNVEYDDNFIQKLENVIDKCDNILDDHPNNVDAIFFKGGALGFRARLYAVRESWIDAAMDGKDALPLVYEAYEIDPSNKDVQLGFGIYNYYAQVIPEQYPWVGPFLIFFPSGDKAKGIQQLITTAEEGRYAKIEAQYFLMTLYYSFENKMNEALIYAQRLRRQFPDNPVFDKYYGRILVKSGNLTKAGEIFKAILKKSKNGKRGYSSYYAREAHYYIGLDHFQKNNLDSSLVEFEICENISRKIDEEKETGFLANSLLYQGMIYDLKNQKEKSKAKYEKVLTVDDYKDSHKKSKEFLRKPYKK
ncbi:MAG: tetratricopeptide repeat protein [Bacteroidetes bacterium]|nr:tetratricopeptide repeat protein [Bacteroidota bacterium]